MSQSNNFVKIDRCYLEFGLFVYTCTQQARTRTTLQGQSTSDAAFARTHMFADTFAYLSFIMRYVNHFSAPANTDNEVFTLRKIY